jgi:hypothetical protein
MPSGLDHTAADSPQHHLAHKVYRELLHWSVGMDQVVVMGDLNETLTRFDRIPIPPPLSAAAMLAAANSPIRCLQVDATPFAVNPSSNQTSSVNLQRHAQGCCFFFQIFGLSLSIHPQN